MINRWAVSSVKAHPGEIDPTSTKLHQDHYWLILRFDRLSLKEALTPVRLRIL